jgi:hypothetical protein
LALYPAAAAGGLSQGRHLLPRSHFVALAAPSDLVCPRLLSRPRLAVREIWGEEVHVLDGGRFGRSAAAAATTARSPPSWSRWRPGEPFPSIRFVLIATTPLGGRPARAIQCNFCFSLLYRCIYLVCVSDRPQFCIWFSSPSS